MQDWELPGSRIILFGSHWRKACWCRYCRNGRGRKGLFIWYLRRGGVYRQRSVRLSIIWLRDFQSVYDRCALESICIKKPRIALETSVYACVAAKMGKRGKTTQQNSQGLVEAPVPLAARWAGKRLHNRFYTLCVFCCYYEDFMKSRNVIIKNLLNGLRQGTE